MNTELYRTNLSHNKLNVKRRLKKWGLPPISDIALCFSMKLFRTLFFIIPFLSFSCSLSAKTDEANNNNGPRDIPLGLFYGMEFDEDKGVYIDSLFDTIPEVRHYEFDKKWYYSGDETYNISFHAQLGIYIDSIIPEPIWTNLQPIINKNFAEHISYDAPFDSIYINKIAELVETPADYAKKWGNLMDKFSESMKPTMAETVYQDITPLRVCGVIHKVFDDKDWETYLVEFSFNYHGGCGCPSYADYITFNKYDGHQLTENEILAKYDEIKLRNQLENEFANAKIKNGYEPIGGPNEYTGNLFGASGLAYIKNGILIYFQPYVAGCGAEGQYNIILSNPPLK